MTARRSSLAKQAALRAVRRACYVFDKTPLDTQEDLAAADKRLYRALVAAGWSFTDDGSDQEPR